MQAAAENAATVKGAVGSVKSDAMEAVDLGGGILADMKATVKVPVAGGVVWKASFIVYFIGIIVLFVYTVYDAATSTWTNPVTFMEQEYVTELAYPDIYLCIGGQFAQTYDKTGQAEFDEKEPEPYMSMSSFIYPGWTEPSTTYEDDEINDLKCGPSYQSGPIKWNPETLQPSSTSPCPYKTPPVVGGNCDNINEDTKSCDQGKDIWIRFGNRTSEWCEEAKKQKNDGEDLSWNDFGKDGHPAANLKFDENVDKLSKLLDNYTYTYTDGGNTHTKNYEHSCVKYAAKAGAVQSFDQPQEHIMLKMASFDAKTCDSYVDGQMPHYAIIMTESGKLPFVTSDDGKEEVIASRGYFSGGGFYSLANLRVEMVNDQTKGSSFFSSKNPLEADNGFVTNYKLTMWNKLIHNRNNTDPKINLYEGMLGIAFDDFLVRKITIRYMTFSEILADIGGLWAAAFLLLGILWKKSGYLSRPAGDEMWIFKYLPHKTRQNMLLGKETVQEDEGKVNAL